MTAGSAGAGIDVVALTPEQTKYGAVENRAKKPSRCADLFRQNRDEIDGVIVTLPNFGDERAMADALRMADLNVPVLIQATPGHARNNADRRPPRQLLRENVGSATT